MKSLIILFVVLLAVVGLVALLKAGKSGAGGGTGPWPFYSKRPLTTPEQVLFFRLVEALPGHIVLAQVQLSRFLGVKKGEKFHTWNNRINRKSVDFLVCSKDATVVAAIELDDTTHDKPSRVKADADKDRAIKDAGLRIVRFHVKTMPDAEAIRAAVQPALVAAPISAAETAPDVTTRRIRPVTR